MRTFVVVSIVWLALWAGGAVLFFRAAEASMGSVEQLALPLTGVLPGQDIRVEGVLDDAHAVTAPYAQQPCAAVRTEVQLVTWGYDAQQRPVHNGAVVVDRAEPESIDVVVDGRHLALPVELWQPDRAKSGDSTAALTTLPDSLHIAPDDIARAQREAPGNFVQYSVDEWTLPTKAPVFLLAHVDDVAGRLVLSPDRTLGKVGLYLGTQKQALALESAGATGLRGNGYLFIALASLPFAGLGARALRRRRGPTL